VIKSVKDEEWRTLYALEKASLGQGSADDGKIARLAKLPLDRVRFAFDKLNKKALVVRRGASHALTTEAVEVMAMRDYVRKGLIAALGAIIAKGKESDVYEALDDDGKLFALKFFKLGRTSFTRVRKKRFVEAAGMKNWMTVNYEAANREYSALKKLGGLSEAFPKAIASNRSTVMLEELSGVRLSTRPELVEPRRSLVSILDAMRAAYTRAGLINADLSEYNILTDGERVWLIDWPQAVGRTHPNARELLSHDVLSVLKFFERAYEVAEEEARALEYVEGRTERLEQD
jgi:RIO kinase 2